MKSKELKRSLRPRKTHVLVWNNFDAQDMAGSFEDLLQNILRDPGVETTNVEGSLVWLRSGPTHKSTAGGGHHAARHRRGDRRGNRIGVLRDHHWRTRRWWHVRGIGLAIALRGIVLLLAGSTSRALRRLWEGGGRRSGHVLSHCDTVQEKIIQRSWSDQSRESKAKIEEDVENV